MEVVVQSPSRSPPMDPFNFSGTYLSAPSSPKRFGEFNYLSAPSSPSRISEFYSEFDYFTTTIEEAASSTNNNNNNNNNVVNVVVDDDDNNNNDGFAFFVSRELDQNSSRSAEELFHGGKIKPLKPQSNESKKNDSFASKTEQRRGRERDRPTTTTVLSSSNSGRRVTRSHSPYRKSNNYAWELEEKQEQQPRRSNYKEESTLTNAGSASISSGSNKGSSRRWRLRDFLLFRSASEGRGSSKDAFKKGEEVKGSSFRSSDSSRRKGPVSAHELHYAMKKAESQDMKKKTFLPYRQGILGRLSGFGI